eukprot:TRINITY_DN39688_c0_g1_i1.p1 TRINITY_DN39688_c0_g1~~TRINITY_DN39688_c0_g1_i1.p1  ORF type:complete len:457 (+),score=81.66 TRINITY_DN39688_c0_g1_i1:56-1426(+)
MARRATMRSGSAMLRLSRLVGGLASLAAGMQPPSVAGPEAGEKGRALMRAERELPRPPRPAALDAAKLAGSVSAAAGDAMLGGALVGAGAADLQTSPRHPVSSGSIPVQVPPLQERLSAEIIGEDGSLQSTILERRRTRFESLSERSGHVPDIERFKQDFQELLAKDGGNHSLALPKGSKVRLIFGVLAMVHEKAYRDVHRKTWMAQPGACRLGDHANDAVLQSMDCRFFATFALGVNNATKRQLEEESKKSRDISVLSLEDHSSSYTLGDMSRRNFQRVDGMLQVLDPASVSDSNFDYLIGDKVKKIGWLRFALEKFPWASHIVSADLDTYPHVAPIMQDIQAPHQSQWASPLTKPEDWTEEDNGMYYGASCGGLTGFKQGALFALSRSFLTCMFDNPKLKWQWEVNLGVPGGDAVLQNWIRLAMKSKTKTGSCRDPWWVGPESCSWPDHWAHPV